MTKIDENQYRFMPGRSTEDAMDEVTKVVNSKEEKFIMRIFMDMAAAFDRGIWWQSVLKILKDSKVKSSSYKMIKDYLKGRTMNMCAAGRKIWKKVNRGCPQGSVLGPQMGKMVINTLIKILKRMEWEVVGIC